MPTRPIGAHVIVLLSEQAQRATTAVACLKRASKPMASSSIACLQHACISLGLCASPIMACGSFARAQGNPAASQVQIDPATSAAGPICPGGSSCVGQCLRPTKRIDKDNNPLAALIGETSARVHSEGRLTGPPRHAVGGTVFQFR